MGIGTSSPSAPLSANELRSQRLEAQKAQEAQEVERKTLRFFNAARDAQVRCAFQAAMALFFEAYRSNLIGMESTVVTSPPKGIKRLTWGQQARNRSEEFYVTIIFHDEVDLYSDVHREMRKWLSGLGWKAEVGLFTCSGMRVELSVP